MSSDRYDEFQAWVLATHGDSARTKTITLKKFLRILRTLRGEDPASAENSKFRFWVRNKGFRDSPPDGYVLKPADKIIGRHRTPADLYVPSGDKDIGAEYKKVAVVENFYDIIHGVHVNIDGKGGKHAGQKRTYRTVTETYAFLPREAVTKFLLLCEECRLRPRGCPGVKPERGGGEAKLPLDEEPSKHPPTPSPPLESLSTEEAPHQSPPALIPKPEGQVETSPPYNTSNGPSDTSSSRESRGETSDSSPPIPMLGRRRTLRKPLQVRRNPYRPHHHYSTIWFPNPGTVRKKNQHLGGAIDLFIKEESSTVPEADTPDDTAFTATKESEKLKMMLLAWNAAGGRNGEETPEEASTAWRYQSTAVEPPNATIALPQAKNPARSSPSQETASVHDETSSSGNKDEDDEDEDEEERIDPHKYDPERLKAFNMFVRLFVDENLDRIVPISKQPKEKIQAIIDSCARQFPEFADRARKRIRTYLKSCRRNKRTRDGSSAWEPQSRPTPAHLTSVQAEQILAQACENESHNAKRMRLGMEPVTQPMPGCTTDTVTNVRAGEKQSGVKPGSPPSPSQPPVTQQTQSDTSAAVAKTQGLGGGAGVEAIGGLGVATSLSSSLLNGSGPPGSVAAAAAAAVAAAPASMYRPNFSQAFQRAAAYSPGLFSLPCGLANGPADLSMKTKPLLSHKLNPAEMTAVRQLVTGYRESAAFLMRSADELEQLLRNQ